MNNINTWLGTLPANASENTTASTTLLPSIPINKQYTMTFLEHYISNPHPNLKPFTRFLEYPRRERSTQTENATLDSSPSKMASPQPPKPRTTTPLSHRFQVSLYGRRRLSAVEKAQKAAEKKKAVTTGGSQKKGKDKKA